MIPQDFIQTLLDRTDIVEVIDRQVPLKKAGANYQACCPFHHEKTPSFTVSQSKQFYHCFGCGAHGTAISFLIEYNGMGFIDAVKELASRAGLSVPESVNAPQPEDTLQSRLEARLDKANTHYRASLKTAPAAIDYLKNRGVTGTTAARFELGFANAGWQPLSSVFSDYVHAELEQCGLVIVGDNGKRYDRFRERVMFPIRNERGRLIGFGGRTLGDGTPKYLNSPETPLFHKGHELYGLFEHRRGIQGSGRVVVVEGYMDVVMLSQAGAENAVATLGTAITADQVGLLLRRTDHIVFAFDGDNAGRKAAWRALENCLPALQDGKQVGFLFLPEGEDPDSFVRSQGLDAWNALLKQPQALSEFLFTRLSHDLNLATPEGRVRLTTLARPYLNKIQAPLLKRSLQQQLEQRTGMETPPAQKSTFPSRSSSRHSARDPRSRTGPAPRLPRGPEWVLLQGLLHEPAWAARIPFLHSHDQTGAAVNDLTQSLRTAPAVPCSRDFIEDASHGPHGSVVRQAVEAMLGFAADYDLQAEFDGALARLEQDTARIDLRRLAGKRPSELTETERAALQAALRARVEPQS